MFYVKNKTDFNIISKFTKKINKCVTIVCKNENKWTFVNFQKTKLN